jgi:formate dehydrogenase
MLGSANCPDPNPIEAADALLRAGPWGDQLSVAHLHEAHPHGFRLGDQVDAAATRALIGFEDRKVHLWCDVRSAEFQRLRKHRETAAGRGDGTLRLFGRRRLQSLNSWMHNSERLTRSYGPTLQIHPDDARQIGVRDGDKVRVSSAANALIAIAEVTSDVVAGSACYPHGWGHDGGWQIANGLGGANINLLASDDPQDWEQVSGICLLDGIPVRVEPT